MIEEIKNEMVAKACVVVGVIAFFVGLILGVAIFELNNTQKKYKMNLKCIQGELYEEIRPNMYAKSHLECFEQRTLTP
jgi:hypothetical protein